MTNKPTTQANAIIHSLPPYKGQDLTAFDDELQALADKCPKLIREIPQGELNGRTIINAFGVVMTAPNGDNNLLVYEPNKRPYLAFAYHNHAIILGDMAECPPLAVMGIDNALALYDDRMGATGGACVLSLPNNLQGYFGAMVNAYRPQYAITTDDRPLNHLSVPCVVHFAPLSVALNAITFDEMLAGGDVAIIDGNEWGEIIPLTLAKPRKNPYPIHAFGNLAGVVKQIAHYAQTPLSMAGQSVLGALSVIGQPMVNAPMGYEYKPVSLFLLTEAESGAGKTQTQRLAYKAIFAHNDKLYKEFLGELKQWQTAKNSKSKDKAEFFNYHSEPTDQSPIVKDATTESILDRFVKGDVFNQAWITDEAGAFFGGYSLKADTKANALTSYTDLWSNGTVNRLRMSNKDTRTRASHCRFTLDLSGQRAILSPAINDDLLRNQGFLPRFLLSAEPSLIGERNWEQDFNPYNDPVLLDYWKRCTSLLEQGEMGEVSEYGEPIRFNMPFGAGAKQKLQRYQNSVEKRQAKGAKFYALRAFASRMAENATRIATLLAFFDGGKELTVSYLDNAFLLVEYAINELIYYNDVQNELSKAEKVLQWLIANADNGKLGKTQVNQNAPYRGRELAELLDDLQNANYIKFENGKGRAVFVVLNPCLI